MKPFSLLPVVSEGGAHYRPHRLARMLSPVSNPSRRISIMTRRRIALALRALAIVLAVGAALAPVVQAQTAGANLVGRVTAQDGTALPGATITATQTETGVTRTAVSDSDGSFRLPSLPIGLYEVQVSLDGFSTVTVE